MLPDGRSISFGPTRRDRSEHGVYVVRTNEGLTVKRPASGEEVGEADDRVRHITHIFKACENSVNGLCPGMQAIGAGSSQAGCGGVSVVPCEPCRYAAEAGN